jgi:CheY-like chemotaxis protein
MTLEPAMREKPLVLLVDDEEDFLEIFSTKLTASGFDVVVVHSAAGAIHTAEKIQPDLVLMDISMPEQTGTDAAIALKHDEATKNIKIAFLSSMKDPWPRTVTPRNDLAKQLGVEDFIDKSDDLDVIAKKVREIIDRPPKSVWE